MAKKRRESSDNDSDGDLRKRAKKDPILYVPDTPQDQMKRKPSSKCQLDVTEKCKITKKNDSDGFSESDEFSDDYTDLDSGLINDLEQMYKSFSQFHRVKVTDIQTTGSSEKLLVCKLEEKTVKVRVSGEWVFSNIPIGATVHVISESENPNEGDTIEGSMIITHPDILVSPTTISSSVRCLRQAALGEVFKPTVGFSTNEIMLAGTINHLIFDHAIRSQQFDPSQLNTRLTSILQQDEITSSLSCLDVSVEDIRKKVEPSLKLISTWGKRMCQGSGEKVSYGQKGEEVVKIDKIVDIEENLWSPKYGCKGKVDATVRIHSPASGSKLVPVEVKSGVSRNTLGSIDHRAQVILYTMMLEERYKDKIDSGLLYYIKGQQTIGVPSSAVERRALIVRRNEVADALHSILRTDTITLPGMVRDKMACKWCNHQLSCSVAYRAIDKSPIEEHPLPEMLETMTSALTAEHLEYFSKFAKLCVLESQVSKSKMPWDSRCSAVEGLTLASVRTDEKEGFYHIFRFKHQINLRATFLRLGDYVIISKGDGSAYNIIAGFVTELTCDTFQLYVSDSSLEKSAHHCPGPSYRVTPHRSLSSLHISLGNLTSFMAPEPRIAQWRDLLVTGTCPRFTREVVQYTQEAAVSEQFNGEEGLFRSLNEDQRRAVERALVTEDYLCILGMPGTGKTSTISCLVQLLVARGHSVLLTAYTHSAVDNLVMKLPSSVDIVRLGAPGRIHPANNERSAQQLTKHIRDPKELREFYSAKAVVATTCLGMRHSLFEYRTFDYCIIDEASQITQPVSLGPILHSLRCILVGDHNQLPPLVSSESARTGGLSTSLLSRLCDSQPSAVCELGIQYRMCSDIMLLSNSLVYSNKLRCADEGVARRVLTTAKLVQEYPPYVTRSLKPMNKVVFLDTVALGSSSYETASSGSFINTLECKVVQGLCSHLISSGVAVADIGVLCPYNAQLQTLSGMISSEIEILTADRYQGRDKQCLIISFTRSNADGKVGALISDKARLNVALTRAKCKLIMIGNSDTLTKDSLLASLLEIVTKKQWLYKLSPEDKI